MLQENALTLDKLKARLLLEITLVLGGSNAELELW